MLKPINSQSFAAIFMMKIQRPNTIINLKKQTHELLLGFSPLEREWFSTIEQAIQAHDEDFVL